ncbi:MAG: hypothetical protein JNM66_30625 [Bryobacterales bacterium]|nr:hypothetical protein [Bryobacterales bacterium]
MRRRSFFALLAAPDPTIGDMQVLLNHWERTCRNQLLLAPRPLPWLVLYDQHHAWHVNPQRSVLKAPVTAAGEVRWAGRRLGVRRVANTAAGVWLPDGETIPIELGAAAKPWPRGGRKDSAVFVQIPLPSLFRSKGAGSISTQHWHSLALHEFTHTLHFLTVVRQWRALQAKFDLPRAADDDMIETAFKGNAEYVDIFNREKKWLEKAVFANDAAAARAATRESLALARQRQRRFFQPGWTEAEALWLSLEGCALWVQVRFELENAPAGQPWPQTAMGMAGFMGSWSHEHGAGLFWMIGNLVPGWRTRYFGGGPPPSPFDVLEQAL